MTRAEKNVAYVVAVISAVLLCVPASREFIIQLATFCGAIVWFGLVVLWNMLMSNWMIVTGIVMGALFVAAAVTYERTRSR